jgi:two-component system, sensor histidine kinase and response regulator
MLTQLLAYLGASSKEAVNGVAAVSMMLKEGHTFDMILMDIQMPIMDGFEATKRIRAAGKSLPILALSADITTQTIENASKCGMDGYLSKPLEHEKLLKYMIKHFNIVFEKNTNNQKDEQNIEFPSLSCIDVVRGLGIFNNNAEAYASILKKLSKSINENMDMLREQLNKSDMGEAKKTAHAMKGACSNLGAFKLSNAWLQLESAIKYDDKNDIADSVIVIENAVSEYHANMEVLDTICFNEKSEEKKPLEASMLELLQSKIKNHEVEAKSLVYKILKGYTMENDTQKALHQCAEALEKYDFAKADKTISTITPTSTQKEN